MIQVKAKLESGSDSEEIAFVESLFDQKNFKDATRMYRYMKMVKLEKVGQRPHQRVQIHRTFLLNKYQSLPFWDHLQGISSSTFLPKKENQ